MWFGTEDGLNWFDGYDIEVFYHDPVWSPKGSTVKILDTPPVWESTWFIILAVLATLTIISGIYKIRIRNIQVRKIILEKLVIKRTKELNQKNDEVEKTLLEITNINDRLNHEVANHRKTGKELKKSEKKYKDLFEKSDDAILIIKNGKIIDCNLATVKMFRYNKKTDLLNVHPSELSPELQAGGKSSIEKADKMMNIALEKGSHRFIWDHIKADGEIFPVEVLLTSIPTDGKSNIIHKVLRDITERLDADRLQSVVYQISKATHSADDLNALYKSIYLCLKQVLDVTNFYIAYYDEKEKLLSFPFFRDSIDSFPVSARPLGKGLTEYIMKTGTPLLLKKKEIEAYARNGEIEVIGTLPEIWIGAPLKIGKKVIGAIAANSYRDPNLYTIADLKILAYVSEQIALTIQYKQALIELEVEKRYLDELFTNSPDALALVTTDSTILQINNEFTRLFGYTKEECLNNNIDELLVASDARIDAHKYTQDVVLGKRMYFDTLRRKKDGTMIQVSVLSFPVNYKGRVLAAYTAYRDITDRKAAVAQIKKSEKKHRLLSGQLNEANVLKESLLDIILHDLKNPAGAILGLSELLLEENEENEIIAGIHSGSKNLIQIIENVSTLSKVTLGEKIECNKIDIVQLIKQVSDEFKFHLANVNMELKLNLPEMIYVTANPIIAEVFRNYISNALKYAIGGKKIVIETVLNKDIITVNFIDYGVTLPKEKRLVIFERGVQLAAGAKRGSGLGLAIVKRIAEAHNAKVGVLPNKPRGNIFYIAFPLYLN